MASKQRVAKTATEGVKVLWERKFFRTLQKLGVVEKALAKFDNNFPRASLDMALKRAPFLMRRGTPGNYGYIQQYPYVPEDDAPPRKAKKDARK
jgi:hypothetical protein